MILKTKIEQEICKVIKLNYNKFMNFVVVVKTYWNVFSTLYMWILYVID